MIIQITEDKVESLSEHIEKGLRHIGKAMQCVDDLKHEHMGERYGHRYGERYDDRYDERYGHRMGMRDEYPYEDMGMRRGVAGTGRYSRY